MKLFALGAVGLGVSLAPAAVAQTSGAIAPQTRTVVTPVAPPAKCNAI